LRPLIHDVFGITDARPYIRTYVRTYGVVVLHPDASPHPVEPTLIVRARVGAIRGPVGPMCYD